MMLDQVEALAAAGESESVEFKTTTGTRREATKTVCAMLNQQGGCVLFGVKPDGAVVGQQVSERTMEGVSAELQRIDPQAFPEIEKVRVSDGREVIVVRVDRGHSPPCRYRGSAYRRVGNTTRVMPAEECNRMFLERVYSEQRWENQPAAGWTVDDLDIAEIRTTVAEAVRAGRLKEPGSREPEDLLRGLGLLRDGVLFRAAAVLFGSSERLECEMPQCLLRVARFRGLDRSEFSDNRQFNGNAFALLDHAQRFLRDTLPIAGRFEPGSFQRIDEPLYPPLAVREALANALCHRDYAMGGGSVGLAVYDDRLEVTSTGPLHFGLTPEDLFGPHESRPWNPLIARTFHRRGVIEQWGRGTLEMAELATAAGLPPPEIEDRGDCVTVCFRRGGAGLTERWKALIKEIAPGSPYYRQVVRLGDANRATLGFLPYAAFEQAAAAGRILAFVDGGEVGGYALYAKRVTTGDVSLTHLCVDPGRRGQGIARALVEGIVDRNPNRSGIRLSCRKDYAANAMWPKLGFQRLVERPGRGLAGLPLVTWWRQIARTLFDTPEPEEARMVAAIDTNVLLDILEERDFPASRALTADWVTETSELAVTRQSLSELSERHARSAEFESALAAFRVLEPPQEAVRLKLRELREAPAASHLSEGDLQVVAQAAADGASYLVSRDGDLLKHGEEIQRPAGLNLTNPDDFLLRLQALGGEHSHQTRTIAASGLSFSAVSKMPPTAELSIYRHQSINEHPSELRQRLSIAISSRPPKHIKHLVAAWGEPLALGAMHREGDKVTVTVLRGVAGRQSYTAARQMIHHLRGIVAAQAPAPIVVDDQTEGSVAQALRDEGFKPRGAAWEAVVDTRVFAAPGDVLSRELGGIGGVLPLELEGIDWDRLNEHLVRDYERYAWPAKVFSGGARSYMVPVMPEYARVILGYEEPQERLFELHSRAAAARDNVYYTRPYRFIEAPARIVWWVSGGEPTGGQAPSVVASFSHNGCEQHKQPTDGGFQYGSKTQL